jgi:hypothetical protein
MENQVFSLTVLSRTFLSVLSHHILSQNFGQYDSIVSQRVTHHWETDIYKSCGHIGHQQRGQINKNLYKRNSLTPNNLHKILFGYPPVPYPRSLTSCSPWSLVEAHLLPWLFIYYRTSGRTLQRKTTQSLKTYMCSTRYKFQSSCLLTSEPSIYLSDVHQSF